MANGKRIFVKIKFCPYHFNNLLYNAIDAFSGN